MRPATVALALLLGACGARTGVDVEARDAPDSGFFRTFPCRWSLGVPIEVARAPGFSELGGAVHATSDLVVVSARATGAGPVAALVTLRASPELRVALEGAEAAGPWLTGRAGFLQQLGGQCVVRLHDVSLAPGELFDWTEEMASCALTQSAPGRVESVSVRDFAGGGVATVAPEEGEVRRLGPVGPEPERAEAYLDPEGDGALVIVRRSAPTEIVAVRPGEGATEVEAGVDATFSSAPERLRGGVLVLSRAGDAPPRLRRFSFSGEPPAPVVALSGLRAPPVGALRSNETEALLPLADGSMAYVPLASSELRYVGPVAEGPVEAMEIVLRPGGSAGGLLYVHSLSASERALTFRPLVCNR